MRALALASLWIASIGLAWSGGDFRLALLAGGIGTLEASVLWTFSTITLPETSAAALLALIRFRDILVIGMGFICLRLLQSKTVTV